MTREEEKKRKGSGGVCVWSSFSSHPVICAQRRGLNDEDALNEVLLLFSDESGFRECVESVDSVLSIPVCFCQMNKEKG